VDIAPEAEDRQMADDERAQEEQPTKRRPFLPAWLYVMATIVAAGVVVSIAVLKHSVDDQPSLDDDATPLPVEPRDASNPARSAGSSVALDRLGGGSENGEELEHDDEHDDGLADEHGPSYAGHDPPRGGSPDDVHEHTDHHDDSAPDHGPGVDGRRDEVLERRARRALYLDRRDVHCGERDGEGDGDVDRRGGAAGHASLSRWERGATHH
jgi:hypothetical protein